MRRVAVLAAQVRASPAAIEADPSPEPEPSQLGPPALSEVQLKSFVETGYLVVHAGFDADWHAELAAEAEAITRAHAAADPPVTGSDHQDGIWGPLTPRMQAVITCPQLQAALTGILGPDFVFGGGAHMHVSSPGGQQYHKDGTPVAVKAHEPRGVIMMYYPNGASLEMGPTAVCPGSMYYGRDLRRAPDLSEMHDVHGQGAGGGQHDDDDDPTTSAIADIGLPRSAQRLVTVPPGAILIAHEHLFHRGTASSPGSLFRPAFKMSARRVSEPLAHSDTEHTAGEEKTAPFAYTGASAGVQAVYEAVWAWLRGARQLPGRSSSERGGMHAVSEAEAALRSSDSSEVERTGAAYRLAQDECGVAGVDVLLSCTALHVAADGEQEGRGESCSEATQRAAFYGLRAVLMLETRGNGTARSRVLAALLPVLRGAFLANEGAVCGTAAVLFVLAAAPFFNGSRPCLAGTAMADGAKEVDAELLLAIIQWIERTRLELQELTVVPQQQPRVEPETGSDQARGGEPVGGGASRRKTSSQGQKEGHNVPQAVEDRRRAMVEAGYALARAGMAALAHGDTQPVLRAVEMLLRTATDGGVTQQQATMDGGSGGNKSHGKSVAHGAAAALLQLCSCRCYMDDEEIEEEDAGCAHREQAPRKQLRGAISTAGGGGGGSSMYSRQMSWPVGWQGNDASVVTAAETVGEALRRLRMITRLAEQQQVLQEQQEQQEMQATAAGSSVVARLSENERGSAAVRAHASRLALLQWLEAECAQRDAQWRGLGEWAYVECCEKAREIGHSWAAAV
jgi:hypothetical protein